MHLLPPLNQDDVHAVKAFGEAGCQMSLPAEVSPDVEPSTLFDFIPSSENLDEIISGLGE